MGKACEGICWRYESIRGRGTGDMGHTEDIKIIGGNLLSFITLVIWKLFYNFCGNSFIS